MKEKRRITERIADKVQKTAIQVTKQTVGKSFPLFCHELKISDEVWEWVNRQDKNERKSSFKKKK